MSSGVGSFPAARSISSVKALLSQVPPEQTPSSLEGDSGAALEIQLDKPVAQLCPLIPLALRTLCAPPWPFPSAPGPALPWLRLAGLCTHTHELVLGLPCSGGNAVPGSCDRQSKLLFNPPPQRSSRNSLFTTLHQTK